MSYCLVVIPALVGVAFFTLLERKVLGLAQSRKGPNKISWGGFLQPFADAVKLIINQSTLAKFGNLDIFIVAPSFALLIMLLLWALITLQESAISLHYTSMILLVVLGLGLYPLLLSGWSSNSKYALIGSMRGVAQTISYEISLALVLLAILCLSSTLELGHVLSANESWAMAWTVMPIMVIWLISCVAETNRTPFDFSEGESELVSGFNLEYGSAMFAFIFMAEYGSILFLSWLTASFLVGKAASMEGAGVAGVLAVWWVWLRATLPRHRYDRLMGLAWKAILPGTLGLLGLYLAISLI